MKYFTVPILISLLSCPWALGSTSASGFEEEIETAKAEVAALKEKRELLDEIESATELLNELRSKEESLAGEYEKAETEYVTLEEARIRAKVAEERKKAEGESIGTIETKDGKVFENCTIRKVSDVGLTIRHSRGSSRVAAEDLPDEFQARFSFNEEEAIAQLKAERRRMIASVPKSHQSETNPDSELDGWVSTRVLAVKKDIDQKEIKQVEFRARANCPAKLTVRKTVNHPFVVAYQIAQNEEFTTTVWMHSPYSARLHAASGELLGEEKGTR